MLELHRDFIVINCKEGSIIKKIFYCLLICIFISGCNNNGSNFTEVNLDDDVNSYDNANVYGYRYINRQEKIIKNGYFEDSAGYKFDEYMLSEHFEIYYNSNNQSNKFYASNSIKILEEEYYRILEFLNVEETNMPIVKLHMYDEYEKIRLSIIDELKFDPDDMNINFMGVSIKDDTIYFTLKDKSGYTVDLKRLLLHEFTHVVTTALTGGKTQIDWLWEGTSKYLAQDRDFSEWYYKEMLEKGLPEFYMLKDESRYTYGYSMVEYIIQTYGREKLIELLVQQGDIEDVLNITEDEFQDGWKGLLEEKIELND